MPLLQLRRDVFDHGLFPCPPRLTSASVLALSQSLLNASSPSLLSLPQWIDQSARHLSLSQSDAEIYFELFKVISGYRDRTEVDFRCEIHRRFLLFLSLQLSSSFLTRNNARNASAVVSKFSAKSWLGKEEESGPGATSPRGRIGVLFGQQKDAQHQNALRFVKMNIDLFLKVVKTDDGQGFGYDFDALEMILEQVSQEGQSDNRLASYLHNKKPSLTEDEEALGEWINAHIETCQREVVAPPILISGLSKVVVIKTEDDMRGKEVRISNCEESHLFLNASMKHVLFQHCRGVTCFLASIWGICTMDGCENCVLTVCSSVIRIGNSVNSTIHAYSVFPPILYGDNHAITLAPFNANYPSLPRLLTESLIPQSQKCVNNWRSPIELLSPHPFAHCFSLMQEKDFCTMILPRNFNSQSLSCALTSEQYVSELRQRADYFVTVQKMISRAHLTRQQETALRTALHNCFLEHLATSERGMIPIDLIKSIDPDSDA